MTAPDQARTYQREAFWTLVVGAPAVLSILRLWVESGGELQTTLLLVANVGPVNLVAALFTTLAEVVTVVVIFSSAVGGILKVSVEAAAEGNRLRRRPPMSVRLVNSMPRWFLGAAFLLALLTWRIVYLPLLLPAAVAAFQRPPWRLHETRAVGFAWCVAALAAYGWLVAPAVRDAWDHEFMVAILLVSPPLVAFVIAGPAPAWFARAFALVAESTAVLLAVVVAFSIIQTPILPSVVVGVRSPSGTEFLRGQLVAVNDVHLALLLEDSGVRFIPAGDIQTTALCGTPEQVPAFVTRVRDYHVEDSLLRGYGRHLRPLATLDPMCRVPG